MRGVAAAAVERATMFEHPPWFTRALITGAVVLGLAAAITLEIGVLPDPRSADLGSGIGTVELGFASPNIVTADESGAHDPTLAHRTAMQTQTWIHEVASDTLPRFVPPHPNRPPRHREPA